MKSTLVATVILTGFLTVASAQQDADEKYIAIYGVVEQAESQAQAGDPRQALESLTDAQNQLLQFQKTFPDWNPSIVKYRLDDLSKKIAAIQGVVASAPSKPVEATGNEPSPAEVAKLTAEQARLQAQLQSAQAENTTLQAKLKEALSSQPAAVDPTEWARAQEMIRSLMKENDLLKANAILGKNTNASPALRRQLAEALDKYSAEHSRAEKLVTENETLQQNLKNAGGDANAVNQLRNENDRLKTQLSALQSAANGAAAAGETESKLKDANAMIASLQSKVATVTLEKGALETKVKQLSAEVDELHAANYEGRIRDLTQQRDELKKQLAEAGKKNSRKSDEKAASKAGDAQLAELNNEIQGLHARLAVDEAKPIPYSAEELALLRSAPPQPSVAQTSHSIHELPRGTAELVASAQRHFSNHEYDAAEADYQKILDRDQNNGLVLANLATIELQENKLADAEKHITAALAQSPDDAYNLSTLGYLKYREEKYDDAFDALSRAAKLDPDNPEIQNYLGVTLSHKGMRAQAETALRRAIEINPLYAPAHNNLAVIYLNQTPPMPMLARWHYQKAVAAGQPRNPDLEKLLAEKGAPVSAQ
jgi:cytochrome c-type biogenesis protein CcmH/NrfG